MTALPAVAEAPPPAVIIFDGSGSMWGELSGDKAQKLETARSILRTKLQGLSGGVRAGFVSFGHRRKGACADIEVLATAETGPPERLITPLDALDPKGKGPIGAALREAHKLLASDPKGTIILIHDGPDNCGVDPCTIAAEIAKANAGITIHNIALSLEPQDATRLACVAKTTNGRMFNVQDSHGVETAITEVMKLARLETGAPQSAPEPETSKSETPAETTESKAPGLTLSASLADGGPELTEQIRWRIFKDGQSPDPVLERSAPHISEPLPPGKYTVEAHLGLAVARGPVEIPDEGHVAIKVPLAAGKLNLSAPSLANNAPLPDALLTLWKKEASTTENQTQARLEPVWLGRGGTTNLILPAGAYTVRLDTGLAKPEQDIEIKPGGEAKINFETAFGLLQLSASATDGGGLIDNVSYIIAEDDPDAPQGRREIARTAHPAPSFSLPSGTYYVTARTSSNEVRQRIALSAGDVIKRTIAVGLIGLEVSASMDAGQVPPNARIEHRVLALEGEPREIARATANPATFTLGSGRYRIETVLGSENVRATSDVDVQPGRDAKVTMKLQAARVSLKSAAPEGDQTANWEIRDGDGDVIWRSASADGDAIYLAPGRYVLRTNARDHRPEKPFELKAGESRILDLDAP